MSELIEQRIRDTIKLSGMASMHLRNSIVDGVHVVEWLARDDTVFICDAHFAAHCPGLACPVGSKSV